MLIMPQNVASLEEKPDNGLRWNGLGTLAVPARPYVITILVLWLAATSWLFVRDLWPRLRPGGPPPFVIDLADEASEQFIHWTIYIDGRDRGSAQTRVTYRPGDDTFELSSVYRLWPDMFRTTPPHEEITCSYRVTREGQLLEIDARVRKSLSALEIEVAEVDGQITGRVENGRLTPRVTATVRGQRADSGPLIDWTLSPIEVPTRGSILNPFQPLNKIRGLSAGQRWRMPYFDPLETISQRLLPGSSREYVDAEVLAPTALPDIPLQMGPNKPSVMKGGVRCFSIRYTADDVEAIGWVREVDGVMVRQEVTKDRQTVILNRDS